MRIGGDQGDGAARRRLTVAVAQVEPVRGDVTTNVARTCDVVARAAAAGASLVVLPELSLTGYDLPALADSALWFSPDDERLDKVRDACRRTGVTAVVSAPVEGAPVRAVGGTDRVLAALVVDEDGRVVVVPKTHLHGDEVRWFRPGAGPGVVDVAGWRVGVAICFDTAVPDHAADAARAGADLYVASVLYVEGEESSLAERMSARARDTGMHVVAANTAGRPLGRGSAGGSAAWAPDGTVLGRAAGTGEQLLVVTLER